MQRGRRRAATRYERSWMFEKGLRVYYGDPHCLMVLVDGRGKPGRRWMHLDLRPPDGVEHWVYLEWAAEMMLKKSDIVPLPGEVEITLVDVKFQKAWPTLWVYLTQTKWEDGSPRQPAGIQEFLQDGMFKLLFKENETQRLLWIAGTSYFGAMDALEAALNSPSPDWRIDRRAGGGVAKKGKK